MLPETEARNITETMEPAPELNFYSSDAQGHRVLGMLGIVLSLLLLVAPRPGASARPQKFPGQISRHEF